MKAFLPILLAALGLSLAAPGATRSSKTHPSTETDDDDSSASSKKKDEDAPATPRPKKKGSSPVKKSDEDDAPSVAAKKSADGGAKKSADEGGAPVRKKSSPSKAKSDENSDETPKKKTATGTKSGDDDAPVPKKKFNATDDDDEKPKNSDKKAAVKKDETTPAEAGETPTSKYAASASIATSELLGFSDQPPRVQKLITDALELSKLNLTYTFGSDDPAKGGMDCSGSVSYLLKQEGIKDVPRDSASQYVWARKHGQFFAVVSKKPGGFEFSDLLPGDLMFWSGTYAADRDPPVTHSMIYLGVQRHRGQHVMWGSSDGRSYDGKQRYGVSVFDFKMPHADPANPATSQVDFLGYAHIPGLREETKAIADPATPAATPAPEEAPRKHSSSKKKE